jgi:hypothetical protein
MHISAADDRFAIPLRQHLRSTVEIQATEIESRAFKSIKEADVFLNMVSEAGWPGEERMRKF